MNHRWISAGLFLWIPLFADSVKQPILPAQNEPVWKRIVPAERIHKPVFEDFETSEGWYFTAEGLQAADVKLSCRDSASGKFSLQVGYTAGKDVKGRLFMGPDQPMEIKNPFDSIELWIYDGHRGIWGPSLRLLLLDADGKEQKIPLDQGRLNWNYWFVAHQYVVKKITRPAKFVGIELSEISRNPRNLLAFDALSFYQRSEGPLQEIPFTPLALPVTPDSILPPVEEPVENHLMENNGIYRFEVNSPRCSGCFVYTPRQGTLNDLTYESGKKKYRIAENGGVGVEMERGVNLAPSASGARKLLEIRRSGNTVHTRWRWQPAGSNDSVEYSLDFTGKLRSLIIEARSDSQKVRCFKAGQVNGFQTGKLLDIPFYTISAYPQRILSMDNLFMSVNFDWYYSNASRLEAQKKKETPPCLTGGAIYDPLTDGSCNPLRERLFLTVSDRLNEVMPAIANPAAPYRNELAGKVFITRIAETTEVSDQDFYKKELAFFSRLKQFGADDIMLRLHACTWHHPDAKSEELRRPTVNYTHSSADPGKGGDEALKQYVAGLKALGWRVGLYASYTQISPFHPRWDENGITLYPDGQWKYGYYASASPKPLYALAQQQYNAAQLAEKFAPDASYNDVLTCIVPWLRVDADSRSPGAGMFRFVFNVYARILDNDRKFYHGPVVSEGSKHMFYAGLADGNYGQASLYADVGEGDYSDREKYAPILPDFQLKRIHPLEVGIGYDLNMFWNYLSEKTPEGRQKYIDRSSAYTLANGNIGLVTPVIFGRKLETKEYSHSLRQYFLFRQLQDFYAAIPIRDIGYWNGSKFVPAEEALRSGCYLNNIVRLEYRSGLTVYVNGSEKSIFPLTFAGHRFRLGPYAFVAADAGGKILTYSAEADGNSRADYSRGFRYTYFETRGQEIEFPEVRANGGGVLNRQEDGSLLFTAFPDVAGKFSGRYVLKIPKGDYQVFCGALDAAPKDLKLCSSLKNTDRIPIPSVSEKTPRYRIVRQGAIQ